MNLKKNYLSNLRSLINQEKRHLAERKTYHLQIQRLNGVGARLKALCFRWFANDRVRNLQIAHFQIGRLNTLLISLDAQIKDTVVLYEDEQQIHHDLLVQQDLYDVDRMDRMAHANQDELLFFTQAVQKTRNALEELSEHEWNELLESHS